MGGAGVTIQLPVVDDSLATLLGTAVQRGGWLLRRIPAKADMHIALDVLLCPQGNVPSEHSTARAGLEVHNKFSCMYDGRRCLTRRHERAHGGHSLSHTVSHPCPLLRAMPSTEEAQQGRIRPQEAAPCLPVFGGRPRRPVLVLPARLPQGTFALSSVLLSKSQWHAHGELSWDAS